MDKFDLMLSYSHDSKEVTRKIFDWFEKQGLNTWIDEKHLKTDLAKDISKGIDSSSVFIPCLSSSYEQSEWCEKELRYAVVQKKSIVPIIVQDGYKMKNDVEFLIAGKKFFTLSQEDFEDTMNEVLKAVNEYTSSTQLIKRKDVSPVQDEQEGVETDNFVLNRQTIVNMNTQPGLDESCNKRISDTSNKKDMEKPIEDLSGNVNHLKINDNPNMPYKRENPEGSETKPNQSNSSYSVEEVKNFDNSAKKSFGSTQQKSAADYLSDDDKKKFKDKLKLPLKDFKFGFGDVRKILDVDDNVMKITNHLHINDEDRKSIFFADHGGGNQPLFFLEYLQTFQPYRKIESVCKCLIQHSFLEAEKILSDNYEEKKTFSEVSHKHVRELSFQLVTSSALNVDSWSDLASDLGICAADISLIIESGKSESNYSRTRKLFQIISMRSPQYTIGDFLGVLRELLLNDAHDLMIKKIIEAMKMQGEISLK